MDISVVGFLVFATLAIVLIVLWIQQFAWLMHLPDSQFAGRNAFQDSFDRGLSECSTNRLLHYAKTRTQITPES